MSISPTPNNAAENAFNYVSAGALPSGNQESLYQKAKNWIVTNYRKHFDDVSKWTAFLSNALNVVKNLIDTLFKK